MNAELDKLIEDTNQLNRQAAVLGERNRIMEELLKIDLPLGVWPILNEIINPETGSVTLKTESLH